VTTLPIAQDPAADELLSRDPLALMIGMLLDQHVSRGTEGLRACRGAPPRLAVSVGFPGLTATP